MAVVAEDADVRSRFAAAFAAAAVDCDGECGRDEHECRDVSGVVWAGTARKGGPGEVTWVEGTTDALAGVAASAAAEELERLRAQVEAARRMLDATREELYRERVEHGGVVAVLARVRALAREWAEAGVDPVEPSDALVAECGRELIGVVGPDAEG
jgi:hypothetical protein